jgi:DNA-binding SARP family transcriptional activator/TolB-like protein/Flp pilus assembly protein TadD
VTGRKTAALLAYLVRRGGAVPRESVMALLWPYSGDAQARASLRQTLSSLRREFRLASALILAAEGNAISLATEHITLDTERFERLARSDDVANLEEAQNLCRGEFLEGIGPVTPEFDRWVEAERGVLRAGFASVLLRLCDAHGAAERTEEAIATALRLLALDPLQEHVHRRVIEAYRQQRRFDAALRQFEMLRSVLEAELGVMPEPATMDLMRDVRRQRSGPAGQPVGPQCATVQAGSLAAPTSPTTRPSIAVLPFLGALETPEAVLLGEGIAEEVIVNLLRDRALLVVSRQSSFHPAMSRATTEEIGSRLGVRFVLTGSVRTAGSRLRVAVHLARCDDGAEIWAETYNREIDDIFSMQSEIARTVMATVAGRILDDATLPDQLTAISDLDAMRLVLLGLRELHSHSASSMHSAVDLLSRAVALAPNNGRALGLLALAKIYERWNYALRTDVADILPIAEQALRLDSRDSRAHCAMGIACLLSRDHDRAGHHFEAGLAVNPNDDLLLIEYGRYLFYIDRPEEALSRIREAMRLNPLHPDWFWNIQGRSLHLLGRHAAALAAFQHITTPAYYHFGYMAACHRALGDDEAAEAMRVRLFQAKPDFDVARFIASLPHRSAASAERFAKELQWLVP